MDKGGKRCGRKAQAAKVDNIIGVNGKKSDDNQTGIAILRKDDYGLPLQFDKMKSEIGS